MSKMALVIPAEELGCAFGQNYETMNGIAFVKENRSCSRGAH